MAKIKEITKASPQPIKGLWWHKVKLDTGEEAFYADEKEEPFKVGDDVPRYEISELKDRAGTRKILAVLPEEPKKIEVSADFGEKKDVIFAAKARAIIDAMGYAVAFMPYAPKGKTVVDIHGSFIKVIHKELDRL